MIRAFGQWRVMLATGALAALLLMVTLAGYMAFGQEGDSSLKVLGDAPSFALTDQMERPVRSDDLRGKVIVADFVYTGCRDICPELSLRMQALQDRLRQERLLGDAVQLLSFTVDPARDTPAVLRPYAERHRADPQAWRFLTGAEDMVVPLIVQGFRLGVPPLPSDANHADHAAGEEAAAPEVMHSARFVLIDREWRIRAYYDARDLDLTRVIDDIRSLLPW